ncbi:MAG: hypothetical protein OXU76_05160, partial [Alphaproteobacteria bacterium]|nr:hypothetical protein [Alphaproteobacteria bacterium]
KLVCSLDILDQKLGDVRTYLSRYLARSNIKSGRAEKNAERALSARKAIPKAWQKIAVDEPDELVKLLTTETEEEEGIKPSKQAVIEFLKSLALPSETDSPSQISVEPQSLESQHFQKPSKELSSYKFSASLGGMTNESLTAAEIYEEILSILANQYSNLSNRLASKLSETKSSRDETDLPTKKLPDGWFFEKNISNYTKRKNIKIACEVAGIKIGKGKDLEFYFSTPAKPHKNTESLPKKEGKRTARYELFGVKKTYPNATFAYAEIIKSFARRDPNFLDRLVPKLNERRKRQLLREKFRNSIKIGDWYLNTILSNPDKVINLRIACDVAGIKFGKDLIVNFPNT